MYQLSSIVLCALASLATCQDILTCNEGMTRTERDVALICCGGEYHVTRRFPGVYKSCNVEPSDPNLSYEDSMWLAYDCIVRKSVRPKQLSLQSYTTFVSGLPESNYVDVMSEMPIHNFTNVASEEKSGVEATKSYAFKYFDVVQNVCKSVYNRTDSYSGNNQTDTRVVSKGLQTVLAFRTCQNGLAPYVNTKPPNHDSYSYTANERRKCELKMKAFVGNVTSKEIYRNATQFCNPGQRQGLEVEDIPSTVQEYESLFSIIWPNFWSKAVKLNATRVLLFDLIKWRRATLIDSNDLRVIIRALLDAIRNQLRSALMEGEQMAGEDIVVNAILAYDILDYGEILGRAIGCHPRSSLTKEHLLWYFLR